MTSSVIVAKSIIDLKRSANPETEYILNILILKICLLPFLACIVGVVNYGHIDTKGMLLVMLKTAAFFLFFIILSRTAKKLLIRLLILNIRNYSSF